MNEVSILKLTLLQPDGTHQELIVEAPQALIGSGSHCELRLPAEDAAVEQLLIALDGSGIFAQVRSMDRQVTLNGVPFVEGRLLSNAVLRIGRVELMASSVATDVSRSVAGSSKAKSGSRGIYALAVVGFPLGFYMILNHAPAERALPTEVQPPPLFAAAGAARCPETAPDGALAFGREELRRAETARERAPFIGQDAVAAVDAFQRAAVCFVSAGAADQAADAQRQAGQLQASVQRDFHVHRVRLERALATKTYDVARMEVQLLLSYVGRQAGAYSSWLRSLDRQIELKFAGKKRK